jgi:uncharacterized membrane protein YtjA (UPF0391 family)
MHLIRIALMFLVIGLVLGLIGFGGLGGNVILLAKLAVLAWIIKFFFFMFILLAGFFFMRHIWERKNP